MGKNRSYIGRIVDKEKHNNDIYVMYVDDDGNDEPETPMAIHINNVNFHSTSFEKCKQFSTAKNFNL